MKSKYESKKRKGCIGCLDSCCLKLFGADIADAAKENCSFRIIGCGLESFRFRAALAFKAKRFSIALMGVIMSPMRGASNCCALVVVRCIRLFCCCIPANNPCCALDERYVCARGGGVVKNA